MLRRIGAPLVLCLTLPLMTACPAPEPKPREATRVKITTTPQEIPGYGTGNLTVAPPNGG